MKRIALAAVLLVSLVGPARAGLDEADRAYIRGDYATALKEDRALAEQGDVDAQFILGAMYDNGKGVPQDYAEVPGPTVSVFHPSRRPALLPTPEL